MRIVLVYLPDLPGLEVVGTLDGKVLGFAGRGQPVVDGCPVEWDDAFRTAMRHAVDEAAEAMFGSEWSGPLSVMSVLNRRSCSKDRVWKHGLPSRVLKALAWGRAQDNPRAFGDFTLGTRRSLADEREKLGEGEPFELGEPDADPYQTLHDRLGNAFRLVRWLSVGAVRAKASAGARHAGSVSEPGGVARGR